MKIIWPGRVRNVGTPVCTFRLDHPLDAWHCGLSKRVLSAWLWNSLRLIEDELNYEALIQTWRVKLDVEHFKMLKCFRCFKCFKIMQILQMLMHLKMFNIWDRNFFLNVWHISAFWNVQVFNIWKCLTCSTSKLFPPGLNHTGRGVSYRQFHKPFSS